MVIKEFCFEPLPCFKILPKSLRNNLVSSVPFVIVAFLHSELSALLRDRYPSPVPLRFGVEISTTKSDQLKLLMHVINTRCNKYETHV